MSELIKMVEGLLDDPNLAYGYLTGVAGTGKTTETVKLCEYLYKKEVQFVVAAYTHKACGVLAEKFPAHLRTHIQTLHSFLSKRPSINDLAMKKQYVDSNVQTKVADEFPRLLIVDEYSMVGERDLESLVHFVDPLDETIPGMKVLFIGDPYQLQPVKDELTIRPRKPHWVKLTELKRTTKTDLQRLIKGLYEALEHNKKLDEPETSENIKVSQDMYLDYVTSSAKNKKVLCFTNHAVQAWNSKIQGYSLPKAGDIIYNSSLKHDVTIIEELRPRQVSAIRGHQEAVLELNAKFKPLEFIKTLPYVKFYEVETELGKRYTMATAFGMSHYNEKLDELKGKAIRLNIEIAKKCGGPGAIRSWCTSNSQHTLAKQRGQAWRELINVKDFVMQTDFTHALTVHKSQGSTYDEVFIDLKDLRVAELRDYKAFLRLYYVAVSRAANKVYLSV